MNRPLKIFFLFIIAAIIFLFYRFKPSATWIPIVGFIMTIFGEPVRQWVFRPRLKVEFGKGQDFITETPERLESSQHKAFYIRIKITNITRTRQIAKNCRVCLVNIEKQNENKVFERTLYCDNLQLAWSCQKDGEQYKGIDIPNKVAQFADVLATRSVTPRSYFPQISLMPLRYETLFKQNGIFALQFKCPLMVQTLNLLNLFLNGMGNGIILKFMKLLKLK